MAFSGQKLTLSGAPDELIPVISPTAGEPTAVATFIAGSQVMSGTSSGLSVTQIGPAAAVNTPVTSAMSPYTVVSSDIVLMCATSGGAISVVLPTAASSTNRVLQIIDAAGSAASNNITVTVSGGGTINGSASYVVNTAYGTATFVSNGTFWLVANQVGSSPGAYPGGVRQVVSSYTGASASGSTAIPVDNTIPQQTEGTQFLSRAITPQSATSNLLVIVTMNLSCASVATIVSALFRDAGSNAVGANTTVISAINNLGNVTFTTNVASASTSSTTFKVRSGNAAGSTVYLNGSAVTAQYFGGVYYSSIVIIEYGA
jgi:hypothetical protein